MLTDLSDKPTDREHVAGVITRLTSMQPDGRKMQTLVEMLYCKRRVKMQVAGSEGETGVEVRDVALEALLCITGEDLLGCRQVVPVKAIISCGEGANVCRFHLPRLTDTEYTQVIRRARSWLRSHRGDIRCQDDFRG